jgi:hypothetical protein
MRVMAVAAAMTTGMAWATAAQAQDTRPPDGRVIVQSVPPGVPVEGRTPPLKLTDDQRHRIQQVLSTHNTEVDLALKSNAPAKSFEAKVDETIPKQLKPEAFPPPLINEIPATREYSYLKFKGQVLIVNPMTHKIVDLFPEAGR